MDSLAAINRRARGISSRIFWSGVALLAAVALVLGGPTVGQSMESRFLPALTDWKPSSIAIDGKDLIVSGTMVKPAWRESCIYIPPQRAADAETGEMLHIVSTSPTSGTNWTGDKRARRFGPWRVIGGAGKKLEFFSEHQCHPGWRIFSGLGTIDNRGAAP